MYYFGLRDILKCFCFLCLLCISNYIGELNELLIKNSKGDEDIFCDRGKSSAFCLFLLCLEKVYNLISFFNTLSLGVYTKNRNFRLYLSSKIGRNSPLVLSKKNHFQVSHVRCDCVYLV